MKTIEEAFNEWSKTCISALWGKSATEFKSAFKAGADFALANQWVSVEDRLPEGDKMVFCLYDDGDADCCSTSFLLGLMRNNQADAYYKITHWMPIPELNKDEQ